MTAVHFDNWRTVVARVAILALAVVAFWLLERVEAWRLRKRAIDRSIAELNDIWSEYASLAMRAAVERGATPDQAITIGTAVADQMLALLLAERAKFSSGGATGTYP
jgi:hypothetical protein